MEQNKTHDNTVINKFIHIIKNENISSFIKFIEEGNDVNVQYYNKPILNENSTKNFYINMIKYNHLWTPIMFVIYFKKIDFLAFLLLNKANPNICEYYGISPFTLAMFNHQNNTEYCKMLIEYGADINIGSMNSLHLLSKIGNSKLLKFVLSYPHIIDKKDLSDYTPLLYACLRNNIECIKLLLKYNANINSISNYRNILMNVILSNYNENIIQLLIQNNINIHFTDNYNKSALTYCIENGYFKLAVSLINKKDANIHIIDNKGKNLLMYASKYNNIDLFNFLIQLGINVNHLDNHKNNILIYLCANGNIECLQELLKIDININHKNDYFISGYIVAKYYQQKECIQLLIKKEVTIDDNDESDDSYYPYYYLMSGIMEV
jgi:ankyrin repeat protein